MARFQDRVVLVTGASSGIGRAVALRVASEGAAVVLAGRSQERLAAVAEAAGGGLTVAADLTEDGAADRLVAAALDEHGRLDAAFNNAGGVLATGPITGVDDAAWDAELALSLTSVFRCLRAEVRAMRGGAIVNNASIAAVGGTGGLAAYTAAKHGVLGLTRSVARECAESGPRVNALITGNVDTPLYRELLGVGPDAPASELHAPNPAGRVASADEVAAFVAFLLSDEAPFVTGAALAIDGGFTA